MLVNEKTTPAEIASAVPRNRDIDSVISRVESRSKAKTAPPKKKPLEIKRAYVAILATEEIFIDLKPPTNSLNNFRMPFQYITKLTFYRFLFGPLE